MGSFKVKLVVYFLLLSLLPLAAAFWGFSTVAAQSEARRVDARLQARVARSPACRRASTRRASLCAATVEKPQKAAARGSKDSSRK